MFLSKKGLVKIILMATCYFLIGSLCVALALLLKSMGIEAGLVFWLGAILYMLILPLIFFGRYAEGKGNFINLGNKLVHKELRPAEFLREYQLLRNSKDLVVNKPSLEVLQLVATAYDSLDDKENCIATFDEMIALASEKKKAYARLLKTSVLFSYGETEEAERLFSELQKQKLDMFSKFLVDTILKSDRAMAMGDYKTAEIYNLSLIKKGFPKLDNLGKLVVYYKLGEIYEKLEDKAKAKEFYLYCANLGGETAIKTYAMEKLQNMQ